jgi:hypothetical protein
VRTDDAVEEEVVDTRSFDAITRRAALMTLGSAGLATLAGLTQPMAADAKKKNRNKNKNKNKGDVNKRCKKQVGQCTITLAPLCEGNEDCPAILACCSFLGACNVTGFFDCLIEAQQPSARVLG